MAKAEGNKITILLTWIRKFIAVVNEIFPVTTANRCNTVFNRNLGGASHSLSYGIDEQTLYS
ncbi:MAG TPA: hypothetical protein VGK38_02180 [Prolixibacteraceae bacterium]|jgi:hypothetical protein